MSLQAGSLPSRFPIGIMCALVKNLVFHWDLPEHVYDDRLRFIHQARTRQQFF
jgi:hypothetical protein